MARRARLPHQSRDQALQRRCRRSRTTIERWEDRRDDLDYEIDGIVVKIDRSRCWDELGFVGREPRWAIAYKFPPMQATTKLLRIAVNVGRTGSLNPFAMLEPVQVGGVTVKLATLHNEDDIRRKDIRDGDTVIVQRAGEVIPQVVGPVVEQAHRQGEARTGCRRSAPSAAATVVRPEGEAMSYCPNSSCPAQIFRWIAPLRRRGAWTSKASASAGSRYSSSAASSRTSPTSTP